MLHTMLCDVTSIVLCYQLCYYSKGSVSVERQPSRISWGSYRERNQKSKTAVARGRVLRSRLPSPIFDTLNGSSPSCSSDFHLCATPRTPRGSLTEGHVKVMLAYSHSLSHDHQGFRPTTPDHREAAGPVRPAATSVQVHCDHQTVPS